MARVSGSVVCSLAVAAATIAAVLADLRLLGPYKIDVETFESCEGGGGGIILDVYLVSEDNEEPVYEGNITYTYDFDNPLLVLHIVVYKWGSTGGWMPFYTLQALDAIPWARTNFPNVKNAFFRSLGISNDSLRAGTYRFTNFRPRDLRLVNFMELPYGRFKVVFKQFLLLEEKGCFLLTVNVKEVPPIAGVGSISGVIELAKQNIPIKDPFKLG